jgi:hypothetical protein
MDKGEGGQRKEMGDNLYQSDSTPRPITTTIILIYFSLKGLCHEMNIFFKTLCMVSTIFCYRFMGKNVQPCLALILMYYFQHCFICRPSDSTVSEDARIEPRTVTTLRLLAVIRSNHSPSSSTNYIYS